MLRSPDPRIQKAYALFCKGLKLIDIANKLDLPEGTVRRWKCTYKWESECSDRKANVRKKGAPQGNRNAAEHGAPIQNKNALTTGEFETLFFDTLDSDEHQLIQSVQPDKEQLLLQEIQLLTVRERRMLKRIDNLRRLESDTYGSDDSNAPPPGMTVVKYSSGLEKGQPTELKEFEGILGQIQSIEDALTRVQGRRQRAIETLHKFGYDDAHLELVKAQINKLTGDSDKPEKKVVIINDV